MLLLRLRLRRHRLVGVELMVLTVLMEKRLLRLLVLVVVVVAVVVRQVY